MRLERRSLGKQERMGAGWMGTELPLVPVTPRGRSGAGSDHTGPSRGVRVRQGSEALHPECPA